MAINVEILSKLPRKRGKIARNAERTMARRGSEYSFPENQSDEINGTTLSLDRACKILGAAIRA